MLDVFKRILVFSGPEIDIQEFFDLIENIEEPSKFKVKEAAIQQKLKKFPNLHPWYDLTLSCFALINAITTHYKTEANQTFNADVCAPLLAELLPNDKQDLDALKYKACQVFDLGMNQKFLGWFFTILVSAIEIKTADKAKDDPDKSLYETIGRKILEEEQTKETERCKAFLLPARNACTEYKIFLFSIIKDHFQQKFAAVYKNYFEDKTDKDEAFQRIYLDIQRGEKSEVKDCLADDNMKLIFEKYSAVLMINYALEKQNPTTTTLATFAEAYLQNKLTFDKKHAVVVNTDANAKFSLWRVGELFKRTESPEEKFFRVADPLSKQIKTENDAYYIVRGEYLNRVNAATSRPSI